MDNTFFTLDDFVKDYGKQIRDAEVVYLKMKENGLKEYSLAEFDFHFLSNDIKKLKKLNEFLLKHYAYRFVEFTTFLWKKELRGVTNNIPITKENLICWVLDMAKRGFEFDCQFEAYGSLVEYDNQKYPDFDKSKEEFYFKKALECHNNGDLSGAIFNWSIVLEINPKDPNSYYSRAVVKNELYAYKSALGDYDKAIEIAPNFISAIINRGALKDTLKDYMGAIEDYNKAIELKPDGTMAYSNRGNTKFKQGDKKGACMDWKKAFDLGDNEVKERYKKFCE